MNELSLEGQQEIEREAQALVKQQYRQSFEDSAHPRLPVEDAQRKAFSLMREKFPPLRTQAINGYASLNEEHPLRREALTIAEIAVQRAVMEIGIRIGAVQRQPEEKVELDEPSAKDLERFEHMKGILLKDEGQFLETYIVNELQKEIVMRSGGSLACHKEAFEALSSEEKRKLICGRAETGLQASNLHPSLRKGITAILDEQWYAIIEKLKGKYFPPEFKGGSVDIRGGFMV